MYLFIDTETTGLPSRRSAHYKQHEVWPHVVSVSWALYASKDVLRKHEYSIVKPEGFTIPAEATKIHGISTAFALEHGIPLEKVLAGLAEDIYVHKPSVVVAHNAAFDFPVLMCEMDRTKVELYIQDIPVCCTMTASTAFCAIPHPDGHGYKWPRLVELHQKLFGEDFGGQHDASKDVLACARCFFQLESLGLIKASPFRFCSAEPAECQRATETRELISIISAFADNHPEFDASFFESVRKQFQGRGYLSEKQFNALNNIINGWRMRGPAGQPMAIP